MEHNSAEQTTGRATTAYESEVRFAIVMYGGVSLAIYMNGIAQEMLRLVRATAPRDPDGRTLGDALLAESELTATEVVYRKLGRILGCDGEWLPTPVVDGRVVAGPGRPIRTRFVIDRLSGTSAGGINAVFLAKALAKHTSMDELKRLWRTEGDIHKLLNDRLSWDDPRYRQQVPQSLLSSPRMYHRLLIALEGMDPLPGDKGGDSPLVDELELFVTATEIRGVPVTVKFADTVQHERVHRHVFRFLYASARAAGVRHSDFEPEHNRMLAFAARCTSAFPFAFEPMTLIDVKPFLPAGLQYDEFCNGVQRFFHGHLMQADRTGARQQSPADAMDQRAFSDGGILDNKPFTFATEGLQRRRLLRPVTRRLFFIDPSPEHPVAASHDKPDAIETTQRALFSVRGYEPIREDLEKVMDRNWTLRGIRDVQDAVVLYAPQGQALRSGDEKEAQRLAESSLSVMAKRLGATYPVYHRLRVRQVIQDVASAVTRAAGFEENGSEYKAIHLLVDDWVRGRYAEDPGRASAAGEPGPLLQTGLLLDLDFGFRLRRLQYVRERLTDLYRLDGRALELLDDNVPRKAPGGPHRLEEFFTGPDGRPDDGTAVRGALDVISLRLNDAYVALRVLARTLRARRGVELQELPAPSEVFPFEPEELREAVKALHHAVATMPLAADRLQELLRLSRAEREQLLRETMRPAIAPPMQEIVGLIANLLERARAACTQACFAVLKPLPPVGDEPAIVAEMRAALNGFYEGFELYDLALFPLRFGSDVADAEPVEMTRISPEDATGLIDLAREGETRRKLAGDRLGNFAAFVDELWRRNDMMWGRLDGAERIVSSLLPLDAQAAVRRTLVGEAFASILDEEINENDRQEAVRLVLEIVRESRLAPLAGATPDQLRSALVEAVGGDLGERAEAVVRACLTPSTLLKYFHTSYEVRRSTPAAPAMRAAARATRIVGQVLEGVARRRGRTSRVGPFLARLGLVAWGFTEVAVPHSFWRLSFRYVWSLLTFMALLVFLGAGLAGQAHLQVFGQNALLLLGAVLLVQQLVEELITGRTRRLVLFGVALVGTLALYGVYALLKLPPWRFHAFQVEMDAPPAVVVLVAAMVVVVIAVIRDVSRTLSDRRERARRGM